MCCLFNVLVLRLAASWREAAQKPTVAAFQPPPEDP